MTRQVSDELIWKGARYYLEDPPGLPKRHDGLVEQDPDQFSSNDFDLLLTRTTACRRGYVATWVVADDRLYLDAIIGSRSLVAGPLLADWVSGKLLAPTKPLGLHINISFTPQNIEYLRITVEKGAVVHCSVGKGVGDPYHAPAG